MAGAEYWGGVGYNVKLDNWLRAGIGKFLGHVKGLCYSKNSRGLYWVGLDLAETH